MKNQNKISVQKWTGKKEGGKGKYGLKIEGVNGIFREYRFRKSQLIQLCNDIDNLTDKIPF
jgi:hypothetical protein